jgi:hypothetical protein
VCAALVALLIAGAGLIPTQPVAGRGARPGALYNVAAPKQLKLDQLKEASGGVHPLTMETIISSQQKLQAADGVTGDQFGVSIALSGDTLVVGANGDDIGENMNQGSAYVFIRSGGGWIEQQKLIANDGAANDYFGVRVAVSGDTLVVGAYCDDIGANADQGSVYVFTRSNGVWTQQQKLVANGGLAGDIFGIAVALSGDTLAVGSYADIGANYGQGSVYVFTRNGGVWTQQQQIIANDGDTGDVFGNAVALNDDTLVVGANGDDIGENMNQGSAYVFTRNGGVWTQQQKLTASDGAADDWFGGAVAVSGDTVVVGALLNNKGWTADQGSAYVFTRSGGVWTEQQQLTADDGAANDNFGSTVAISDDTMVVGARMDDLGGGSDQGSAYIFTRSGGFWTQQEKITASDAATNDFFSFGVALSGDTLAVSASGDDINTNVNQGSAYLFTIKTCPTLTFTPASLPYGVSGVSYQQQITVSGGVGPYQFAVVSGVTPPGMSLTANGLFSGATTTHGTYLFKIRATDLSTQCSSVKKYNLTILATCPSITIDPPTLPNGSVGARYRRTLTATGGTEPYRFGVKGKLPPGLSLSADGVLAGVPTQPGSFSFWLLVADGYGCEGIGLYSITIAPGNSQIGVATPATDDGRRVVHSQPSERAGMGKSD